VAHPDLDSLLDPLLTFAQQMLSKHGGFTPFGASMSADGTVALADVFTDPSLWEATDIAETLVKGFRAKAQAGGLRAAGVCLDVRVVPPGEIDKVDAVCARLEHVEGQSVEVYLPYRKERLSEYAYGEIFATPGEARIFVE
jgi:hypothetical protein